MDFVSYVNPNIGGIGHLLTATRPAVQSPHGAVSVFPAPRPGVTDRYNSDKIFGFHANDAIVMPISGEKTDYLEIGSTYDHDFEEVHPDYYSVYLEDIDTTAELTAYHNTGIFRFYGSDCKALAFYIYGTPEYRIEGNRIYLATPVSSFYKTVKMHSIYQIEGCTKFETTSTQVENQYHPGQFDHITVIIAHLQDTHTELRFNISSVSAENCLHNFENTVLKSTFEQAREKCHNAWNKILSKIRVTGDNEDRKTVFYTALYRVMSRMRNFAVDGQYIGYDGKIHDDEGVGYYCDDGIWDTYRGAHPLQMLLEPDVHKGILASYLRMFKEGGWMARFPSIGGNIPCMLGFHTVSLYADALAKGFPFDLETAYAAAYKNAMKRTMCPWCDGEAGELTHCYHKKGFFPGLEEDEEETSTEPTHPFENRQSVAVTIEQSYDDWCVAQLAKALGKKEDAIYFEKRALNYRNVYNKETGFVHPRKMDGSFTKIYNPKFCGGQGGRRYFAENNAYIYNFAAQHDPLGMVKMHGGKEAFEQKMDNLFVEQYDGVLKSTFLMQYPDATGLTGQFCMGNEPSFHIPYLYNFCGKAYKTQRKVHELMDLWFTNSPFGICGDEDGGAMSAFAAFTAMGFYTVTPGSDRYDLGSPLFDRIEIDLPNGKTFTIEAEGAAHKAKYIAAAQINGENLTVPYFTHAQMMEGKTLSLTMSERPNKALWADAFDA